MNNSCFSWATLENSRWIVNGCGEGNEPVASLAFPCRQQGAIVNSHLLLCGEQKWMWTQLTFLASSLTVLFLNFVIDITFMISNILSMSWKLQNCTEGDTVLMETPKSLNDVTIMLFIHSFNRYVVYIFLGSEPYHRPWGGTQQDREDAQLSGAYLLFRGDRSCALEVKPLVSHFLGLDDFKLMMRKKT